MTKRSRPLASLLLSVLLTAAVSAAALAPPANDNFANATTLNGNSGFVSGTNVEATKEAGEPNHAGVAGGASVWYRWQAPSPGTLTVNTSGSNFNTTLAVYTGAAVGSLTSVGSNDDVSGTDHTSRVSVTVNAGTTYQIAVDGSGGETGSVALNWSFTSSCFYSFNPSAGDGFNADAQPRTITVITQTGCPWTAVSNNSFLTIDSGASGNGTGLVSYSAAANPSLFARQGTFTIAGRTYSVIQTGRQMQMSASSVSVSEAARKVTLTVYQTGSPVSAVTVNYATADGTAGRRGDYTQTLGTLAFAAGDKSKTVTVFVTDDVFAEPDESFTFNLSNPFNDPNFISIGSPSSTTVNIQSDDITTGLNPVTDPGFSPDFFVRQHYVDFLNREADPSGLTYWTNQTMSCGSPNVEVCRINVSAAFLVSIEFQNSGFLAYRMYKAAYGDATSPGVAGTVPVIRLEDFLPDTQRIGRDVIVGATGWEAQLEANKQAYALEFVQRPRFQAAFPFTMSVGEYVDKLIANTGSAISPAERDQLIAEMLANNTPPISRRASVLRKVAEDADLQAAEFNRAFVLMAYYGYLRRNPDDPPEPASNFSGWKFWLDKLNQFNGNYIQAEIVKAFLSSAEYRQRFGP